MRKMHDLIFQLYAAFRYFVIDDDNDKPERKNNDDDKGKRKGRRKGPNKGIAEIARFTGGNLTTLYRWEKSLLEKDPDQINKGVKRIKAKVKRMKAKIETHLENEGKSPEAFRKELQIACGIIQFCNNTASVRVLWELTEKEEVNENIRKAIQDAADIVKLNDDPDDLDLLETQILQRMKSIETTQ